MTAPRCNAVLAANPNPNPNLNPNLNLDRCNAVLASNQTNIFDISYLIPATNMCGTGDPATLACAGMLPLPPPPRRQHVRHR